jgi:hypothetical protein
MTTRPFAQNMKKNIAPCGARTRDPGLIRPKFYPTELKEHHNHTIFGLIFICFSFYNFYLVLFLFYYRINDCVHKIICECESVNNITTL